MYVATVCAFGPETIAATDPFLLLYSPVLTNNQVQLQLLGETGVRYVIESSTDTLNWTPVITNNESGSTRLITLPASNNPAFFRTQRGLLPVFGAAIVARQNVNFLSNDVAVNSYDSADPAKSTYNEYDKNKAQANGDVASSDGFVQVGNANINGKILTSPNGSISFGPNGYAGPIGWTGPGLYSPEWYRNDYRFVFADVKRPFGNPALVPSPTTTLVSVPGPNGTNYWNLTSGDYYFSGSPTMNNLNIVVSGNVRLWVTGDFKPNTSQEIFIGPNSSVHWQHHGRCHHR
jgi:hypothetical protein